MWALSGAEAACCIARSLNIPQIVAAQRELTCAPVTPVSETVYLYSIHVSISSLLQVHRLNNFRGTLFYPWPQVFRPLSQRPRGGHVGFGAAPRRRAEAIWGGEMEGISNEFSAI